MRRYGLIPIRRFARALDGLYGPLVLACALSLAGLPAGADNWGSPQPTTTCSADGRSCAELFPAPWKEDDDQTAWVVVSVRGAERRAPSHKQFALLNPVAPVQLRIANEGRFLVTLDDWGRTGYGERAVVIYDSKGKVVRNLALADFLTASDIEQLPHSVSSIQWRTDSSIDDTTLELVLQIPTCLNRPGDCDRHAELRIDLATGQRAGALEPLLPAAQPPSEPTRATISTEE